MSKNLVSTKELSIHLDVSDQWIRDLGKDGVLKKHSRGLWDLDESRINYIRYLREIKDGDTKKKRNIEEEKLRKTTVEANLGETKLEKEKLLLAALKGEFLDVEISNLITDDFDASIKAKILSIPSTVTPKLEGLTKFESIQAVLTVAIDDILKEFASNDRIERTRRIVREYQQTQRDKLQSSTETENQSVVGSE